QTCFEGLLTNGWLLKSVCRCVLYSSKEVLRSAVADFWCAILLLKTEGDSPSLKIDWNMRMVFSNIRSRRASGG
nr:actin-related protein 2/3 complex subunit 1B, putative isoform 1 [Tanacetum cinerariifolium]